MRIHTAHTTGRALARLSLLLVSIWGCGIAQPEGALKDEAQGLSWVARMFSSRPAAIEDCSGLSAWLSRHSSLLVARVERAEFTAELQYRPAACMACLEDRTAAFMDKGFRARVAELVNTELYVLRIAPRPGFSAEAQQLVLSENLRGDLVEVVGTDTLKCAFVHVEAMPSMLPYTSVIIGFDRPQDDLDRRIILWDRAEGLGGDLTFQFNGLGHYSAILPDSLINGRS